MPAYISKHPSNFSMYLVTKLSWNFRVIRVKSQGFGGGGGENGQFELIRASNL
jgi:hypothetical protein